MTEYETEVAAGFPSVKALFCGCGNRLGGDRFWACSSQPCPAFDLSASPSPAVAGAHAGQRGCAGQEGMSYVTRQEFAKAFGELGWTFGHGTRAHEICLAIAVRFAKVLLSEVSPPAPASPPMPQSLREEWLLRIEMQPWLGACVEMRAMLDDLAPEGGPPIPQPGQVLTCHPDGSFSLVLIGDCGPMFTWPARKP